jgi:hypothetical protein
MNEDVMEEIIEELTLHELLERCFGRLRPISPAERASLQSKGLPDSVIDQLLFKWLANQSGAGSCDLQSLAEVVGFDWQENLIRYGFLSVGSCCNGDMVVVDITQPGAWPAHYASHEHEEIYEGLLPRTVLVATSLQLFLEEKSAEDDYPCDYFDALERTQAGKWPRE